MVFKSVFALKSAPPPPHMRSISRNRFWICSQHEAQLKRKGNFFAWKTQGQHLSSLFEILLKVNSRYQCKSILKLQAGKCELLFKVSLLAKLEININITGTNVFLSCGLSTIWGANKQETCFMKSDDLHWLGTNGTGKEFLKFDLVGCYFCYLHNRFCDTANTCE